MWYDSLVRCGQEVNDLIFDGADFIAWTNLLSFPILGASRWARLASCGGPWCGESFLKYRRAFKFDSTPRLSNYSLILQPSISSGRGNYCSRNNVVQEVEYG